MNRKGQLAFLVFFIVAIALVIAVLVSFSNFSSNFGGLSLLNSKMLSNIEFGSEYVVSTAKIIAKETISSNNSNLKEKFIELAEKKELKVYEGGNFFAKIRNGEFNFEKVDEKYVLKIKELFVQARAGNSEMNRPFNLCLVFGKEGNYLERIANAEIYVKNC